MALKGIKVLELAGLAPGPMCGLMLLDFGASVIRVDKIGSLDLDVLGNGKQSIALNLKDKKGTQIFRELCKKSDVLIDTYRAGVMESLGLGPKILLEDNPRLVYARLTGYGQYGPLAKRAGHDINYVAITGLLSMLHRSNEKPFPPINLLADFGGGGVMCTLGIIMALFERSQSGKGQVVDANMVEGTSYLGSWIYRSQVLPIWGQETGKNVLDGGAPFYEVYETKDRKYMAVGAIEPKFYSELLKGLELTDDECPQFNNEQKVKDIFTKKFMQKTQKEWCEIFDNSDACVSPVLDIKGAAEHPHNVERKSFARTEDLLQITPEPAPKLSRTPGISHSKKSKLIIGQHTDSILKELNYSEEEMNQLEIEGVIDRLRNSKM